MKKIRDGKQNKRTRIKQLGKITSSIAPSSAMRLIWKQKSWFAICEFLG